MYPLAGINLTAIGNGGSGGSGSSGASGGNGGSAILRNEAGGFSPVALVLSTSANGGAGGAVDGTGGNAGAGGVASSRLLNASNTLGGLTGSLSVNNNAVGGGGGNVGTSQPSAWGSGNAGDGGKATAFTVAGITADGQTLAVSGRAQGGAGGINYVVQSSGGNGGSGGDAISDFTGSVTGQSSLDVKSVATGGNGGDVAPNPGQYFGATQGSGGNGGSATATAAGNMIAAFAQAPTLSAAATGGNGGQGEGLSPNWIWSPSLNASIQVPNSGGNGGSARATALGGSINGAASLAAIIQETAGNGGNGINGANGGNGGFANSGGSSSNSISGVFAVENTAIGGNGGTSDTAQAGNGGNATINDAISNIAGGVIETVFATGGNGGSSSDPVLGTPGNGGNADAETYLTGNGTVNATANAVGGAGGLSGATGGYGTMGSATSLASATVKTGGVATATALGNGSSGSATAIATANNPWIGQGFYSSVVASASSPVIPGTLAGALAQSGVAMPLTKIIGGILPPEWPGYPNVRVTPFQNNTFSNGVQAVAYGTVNPSAGDLAALQSENWTRHWATNSSNQAVFVSSAPEVVGVGLMGAMNTVAQWGVTGAAEDLVSQLTFNYGQMVDHIAVGLLNPSYAGNGFDSLTFTATQGATTVLSQSFTDLNSAYSYFNDNVLTLNSPNGVGTTQVTFTLNLHTATGGDGFAFNIETKAVSVGPAPVLPPVTPAFQSTPLSAGNSYSSVAPVTSTGGLGTTASLLDGIASGTKTVTLATTNAGSSFSSLASDVISITGNAGDIFTLQLTFDPTQAELHGGLSAMRLLWLNPLTGVWENAVFGNTDLTGAINDPTFILGGYDSSKYNVLGYYGVDIINDVVWAVIDHNSELGVGNQGDPPQFVPEPSTGALLLAGMGALLAFRRRRADRIHN